MPRAVAESCADDAVYFLKATDSPTPLVDHGDQPAPGVVVVRVLLHVLGEVQDLLREYGHHDAGRASVLLVLSPLELGGLPGQLVQVSLHARSTFAVDDGLKVLAGGVKTTHWTNHNSRVPNVSSFPLLTTKHTTPASDNNAQHREVS